MAQAKAKTRTKTKTGTKGSAGPTLMALVPAAAPLGTPNFTLHVFGAGFVDGDTILWNDSPEPTTFISAHQLATGVNMTTAERRAGR